MHTGARIAVVTGPIDLPRLEVARERLDEFAELGPSSRIGLTPDAHRRRWRHEPGRIADAVVSAPPPADALSLLRSGAATEPFRATLAGDYLLTEHDHGIGEVQLALCVHLIVAGGLAPTAQLSRTIDRQDDGLLAASARTFGSDPRRIRRVLKILKGLPAPSPLASSPPFPEPLGDSMSGPNRGPASVEAATLTVEQVAELRRWREAAGVRASVKTLILCGMVRALTEAGVRLHDDVVIPVDLRRYLRPGVNPLGNFVAGLQFRHRAGDDPDQLQQAIRETVASGRPVASGVRSSVAGGVALRRRPTAPPARDGRVRLLYTGVNDLPGFSDFPWLNSAGGGHLTRIDPPGDDALTLASLEVGGAVTISVTYRPGWHGPNVISDASRKFASDPIAFIR